MRLSKKQFLFFLLFSLFLSMSIFGMIITPSLGAELESEQTTITYDWLSVNIEDSNPNDRLKTYAGGYDLISAENLGSIDHGDGQFTFRYRAKFGFEAYWYTEASIRDSYPELNPDGKQRYKFLREQSYNGFHQLSGTSDYYVTYTSAELGDKFNPHRYDVSEPVTVSLNPNFQNFGGQNIGDIPIKSSDYVWKPKIVEVANYEQGKVGEYEDIIKPLSEEEQWVDIDMKKVTEDASSADAKDYVANRDLGARTTTTETITEQSEMVSSTPQGTTWSNQQTGDFTFEEDILLRPRVELTRTGVRRRYMYYSYNWFWADMYYVGNVAETSSPEIPYIIRKVHTQNYYIHKEYTTTIVFECNVNIENYEQYESLLNKPAFSQGDWIWASGRGGTTELTLTAQKSGLEQWIGQIGAIFDALLGNLLPIIITIIIIVVVVAIIYMVIKRQMGKSAGATINITK